MRGSMKVHLTWRTDQRNITRDFWVQKWHKASRKFIIVFLKEKIETNCVIWRNAPCVVYFNIYIVLLGTMSMYLEINAPPTTWGRVPPVCLKYYKCNAFTILGGQECLCNNMQASFNCDWSCSCLNMLKTYLEGHASVRPGSIIMLHLSLQSGWFIQFIISKM